MGELINGRTPEEIKSWMRCCSVMASCYNCPYNRNDYCVSEAVLQNALAYIQHLEAQQPKWISVKERLPKNGDLALITMSGNIAQRKLFNHAYELACYWRNGEDEEGEYHLDGWELWDYKDGEVSDLEVFYWMPLPQPPEEE